MLTGKNRGVTATEKENADIAKYKQTRQPKCRVLLAHIKVNSLFYNDSSISF